MKPSRIEDIYPLSPLQQGLLFHSLRSTESDLYFRCLSCELRGALDVAAFERAWQRITELHPVFRTSFVWEGRDEPLQVVFGRTRLPWQCHDLQGLDAAEQEAQLAAFLTAERATGFNLSKAPISRLNLFRLAADRYHFVWSFHHILFDGWSVALILRELGERYRDFCQGNERESGPVRPFGDYIAWLQTQNLSAAEGFWRRTLAGFTAANRLGIDLAPNGAPQEAVHDERLGTVGPQVAAALRVLLRRSGITLNTLIKGVWALLLGHYCEARDVVFGAVFSGRPADLPGVESIVGLMVNTLPVRVRLDRQALLLPWLERLQEEGRLLHRYEHSPLSDVQKWSELGSGAPLFDSLLVFENFPMATAFAGGAGETGRAGKTGDVEVSPRPSIEVTNYPLTLLVQGGSTIGLRAVYDRRRFSATAILRLLRHLETLLSSVAGDPERLLGDFTLLTPAERQQIVAEWNDTAVPRSGGTTVDQLVASQAARTPEAVALVNGELELSYGELDRRVGRLARHLRRLGVGPEALVGISLERSLEMAIGLLAVIQAGGAYVPLDPRLPRHRLATIVGQTSLRLVLTQERLRAIWRDLVPGVLCLDGDFAREDLSGSLPPPASDEHLLSLVHTSGSTGAPKGVSSTHRGTVNYLAYLTASWLIGPSEVVLQLAGLSFDASMRDLVGPLTAGARVVLIAEAAVLDPAVQLAHLRRHRVTCLLSVVPTTLRNLAQAAAEAGWTDGVLRLVLVSGEPLPYRDCARVREVLGRDLILVNQYGPTECTLTSSYFRVAEGDLPAGLVPLGGPIPNVRMYAVGSAGRPVALGIPGEMCIASPGLARGYHGRPDLTAERFIPNSWSEVPGDRLYRTGDLVRRREDAGWDFLGRLDQQVKFRGVRVELGEIESALRRHPAVAGAVTVLRVDEPDDARLVAYVVPTQGASASPSELQALLRLELPESMLPSGIVFLDSLPLTPNGKVDRRALPAPGFLPRGTGEAFRPPGTPAEEKLAEIWSQLLRVERVGREDDFFAMGGDSLLSIRMVSRARQAGFPFSVAQVFQHRTLAALARLAEPAPGPGVEDRAASPPAERLPDPALLDRLGLTPDEVEDLYPLSPLQEGLLAHALHFPERDAYFRQLSFRLEGALSVGAFFRAWQLAVDRHPILRTAFFWQGLERPLQVVRRAVTLPCREMDWRELPRHRQGERLDAYLTEELRRGFDLTRSPLLRLSVIRLAEREVQLVWSYHHLILEGWSTSLLLKEVFAAYQAYCEGRAPQLAERRPYGDYIAWLGEQDLAPGQDFWRRELAGFTHPTELDFGPVRAATAASRERSLQVPVVTTQAVDGLARRSRVTVNTVLQGAWALLLSRVSGAADVVFGTVSAGRAAPLTGIEDMLGVFVNTFPVRVSLTDGTPLSSWLQSLQERQAAARQHDFISLRQIHRASELEPGQPLFETIMAFENYRTGETEPGPAGEHGIHGVRFSERTEYALTLIVRPGSRLDLKVLYDRRRFEDATAARLLVQLRSALAAFAAAPETPVEQVSLLAKSERQQVVLEWNDTATTSTTTAGSSLHGLFEAQAGRAPESVAAAFDGQTLTYRELNRAANRLAHALGSLGVGRGTLVALHLPRSLAAIAALLAILKAGGAYVPLDLNFPPLRLQGILASLRIRHLVTHGERLGALGQALADLPFLEHVLCLEAAPAALLESAGGGSARIWAPGELASFPAENPAPRADADDLAYVIFTSGSTGAPKGVMVRHRPAQNLIAWLNRTFGIGAADRVLFVASFSFDLSVYDVFGLLAAGGSIRIVGEADLRDPGRLFEILTSEEITLWDSAPAALQQLIPNMEAAPLSSGERSGRPLRRVLLSGDWIPVTLPDVVRGAFPQARVIGLGGATEATVWSNCFPVGEVDSIWTSIPYGRPIEHASYRVLDARLAPCAIAVAGDLYIGGDCLAAGYIGEPAMTAERFIPDPWSGRAGGRLYRTGDRARHWPDGNLEFLGRSDQQVKVRGFRIELGEIETALRGHEAIRDVAILAVEDQPRSKRLIAYVVPRREPAPSVADLRGYLLERLPEYMVPSAFVSLGSLPLSPNGKLDRRALPAPEVERTALGSSYVAPSTPAEQLLADIWRELLGVERVGVYDHFLELGGDSILSIQMVARANRAGLEIHPRQVYEHPTIAELARLVGQAAGAIGEPALEPGPVTGPVPLTAVQRWFFALDLVDPHHFNQALLLRSELPLSAHRLDAAVERLVEHHDALRARYVREEDGWSQRIGPPGPARAVVAVDLRELPAAARPAELAAVAGWVQGSLDLAAGPLLRVALFDLAPGEPQRLLITIHHLTVDGVSWPVLLEDLQRVYAGLAGGEPVTLPARTVSFRQWAERLQEAARSEALGQQASYWLAEARREIGRLPVDHPGGVNDMRSARSLTVALEERETEALLREVPPVYNTEIQDLLLAALAQAGSAWTGDRRLLVDLETHGRNTEIAPDLDLSRTVGWFTAIVPVLLEVPHAAAPEDLIRSIKEQIRAIPARGIGHGLLGYAGDGEIARRLGSLPRAEVSFNYLGQIDRAVPAASPFRLAAEPSGPSRSPRQQRPWLLQIDAAVAAGRLRFTWTYSANFHRAATIEALAGRLLAVLGSLIRHCASPDVGGFTASDFPLARLDRSEVPRISALLATADGSTAARAARNVEDVYPLSPLQEGMVFHALSARESRAGFEQVAAELRGELNVPAFERAWRQILARHSILRTAFVFDGLERPLQVVRRQVELHLALLDEAGSTAAEPQTELQALLAADRARGFDLARAPLLRLHLIRRGQLSWQLVWSHHHLILDGWSRSLVLNEVFSVYSSLCLGEEARLPPAAPFRRYVDWLESQEPAAVEAFWRRTFAGWRGPVDLGLDRPALRRHEPVGGPGRQGISLSSAATAALEAFAARHQLTLNSLVQGAWALLLSRYSGAEDVVFGVTLSGRPADLPESDSIVGMLINNLPLRLAVSPEALSGPWLQEVLARQQELRLYEQSAPAKVQEWSGLPWSRRLFETLVVFQNYPATPRSGGPSRSDLEISFNYASMETSYPLTLVAHPGRKLSLEVSYQRRLIDDAAVARALGHLATLLSELAAYPRRSLAALALLTEAERHQLEVERPGPEGEGGTAPPLLLGRADPASQDSPCLPPRDALELEILQIWEEVFSRRPIGIADDFFDLGGHSLLALTLMNRIRNRFGQDFPLATLFEGGTVEHLARKLRRHADSLSWSPLVPIQPEGSRKPLFCLHPAAGSVLRYRPLAVHLGPEQPLYALQPRGQRRDQAPVTRIEDMAVEYLAAVRQVQPRGPYALAGWSFGGYVAFEMAHQLVAAGETVDLLAMLDTSVWPEQDAPDDREHLRVFVERNLPEALSGLPRSEGLDEQLRYVMETMQRQKLLADDLELLDMRRYFDLYFTNMRAAHRYVPRPYPGRVTVLRASALPDPTLGWGNLALGGVDVRPIPGRHNTLLAEPHVRMLAETLRACLLEAAESVPVEAPLSKGRA